MTRFAPLTARDLHRACDLLDKDLRDFRLTMESLEADSDVAEDRKAQYRKMYACDEQRLARFRQAKDMAWADEIGGPTGAVS